MITKRSDIAKKAVSAALCLVFLLQTFAITYAFPPVSKWDFIQLATTPGNEVISEAYDVKGILPVVTPGRAFNPIAERVALSFAMPYGQGAKVEVYALASGVDPANVYGLTDPRGTFVGYVSGKYDGNSVSGWGSGSGLGVGASTYTFNYDGASKLGFHGYLGWLPELTASYPDNDPDGIVDMSFVADTDTFVNTIIWDGDVVDGGGAPVALYDNVQYIIVVQPVAASQTDERMYIPFSLDSNLVPVITGAPRGNSNPFAAFANIPGNHEINAVSGNYEFSTTDLTVAVSPALLFTRTYNSQAAASGVTGKLGYGWSTGLDYSITETAFGAAVAMPDGTINRFRLNEDGSYTAPAGNDSMLVKDFSGWTITSRAKTTYTFDTSGNITKLKKLNGEVTDFSYMGGSLTEVSNRNGSISITYDGNNRITQISPNPGSRPVTFEYDGSGNLIGVTGTTGRRTAYTYDNNHRLLTMTDADGWEYLSLDYDAQSRLMSARVGNNAALNTLAYGILQTVTADSNGKQKTYYFDKDRDVYRIDFPDGTEYYEYADGRVTRQTAKTGLYTGYTYDTFGNVATATGPDGGRSVFTYNADNLPTLIEAYDAFDALISTKAYTYDAHGNLTHYEDPNGNTHDYVYDANNNCVSSTDGDGNTTEFLYDNYGRLTGVVTPDGDTIQNEYDAEGHLTQSTTAMGFITRYVYDANGFLSEKIDPMGNSTTYVNNSKGNTTSITDAMGAVISGTYDEASHPLTITDQLGNTTTYTYDADGHKLSATDPENGVVSYTYGTDGQLVSMTDAMGNTWTYTYDGEWRQTGISGPLGQTFTVAYDSKGSMTSFTNGRGQVTSAEYDGNKHVSHVTDPEGGEIFYEYDGNGNLTQKTDPNGNVWTYAYDAKNRLVSATDPQNGVTSFVYDSHGRLVKTETPLNNEGNFTYNADGRLINAQDAETNATTYEYNGNAQVTRITYADSTYAAFEYDALGRLSKATDPSGAETLYAYDAAHRLTEATDALSNTKSYTYTPNGRLESYTDAAGAVTSFEYDKNGNLTRETDALGHSTSYAYDALNRLTSATDPKGGVTRYDYDLDDNVTQTANPDGGVTNYEYDGNSRLTKVTSTITDNAGGASITAETLLAYDRAGNLTSVTDPRGNSTSYGYDSLNRNTSVDLPDGGRESYAYDADGRLVSVTRKINSSGGAGSSVTTTYDYDRNGRVTSITDGLGHSVTFEYNSVGQVMRETDQDGGVRRYQYDANGNVTRYTDPMGDITDMNYDRLGRLEWQANPRANEAAALEKTSYTYDANGRVTTVTDPLNRVTRLTYDALGRILAVTDAKGGATAYDYDANGNIIKTTDALGGISAFAYDSMNRLTSAKLAGAQSATLYSYDTRGLVTKVVSPASGTSLAVYDQNGNLISKTDANGNVTAYDYDPLNRIKQTDYDDGKTARYAYDLSGNLTKLNDWTGETAFEHDLLGRVTRVSVPGNFDNPGSPAAPNSRSIDYVWDSRGNRTSVTVTDLNAIATTAGGNGGSGNPTAVGNPVTATTTYTYDAASRMATATDSGGTKTTYEYFAGGLLKDSETKISPTAANPGAPAVTESAAYTYDPNGNRLTAIESLNASPVRSYSWQYDELGRLTSETHDNIGIGIPQMLNESYRYSYDALSRLTQYVGSDREVVDYTYDASGNLLTERSNRPFIVPGAGTGGTDSTATVPNNSAYTYNSKGQLSGKTTPEGSFAYTYDPAGNLTRETKNGAISKELTYGADNRLSSGANANGEVTAYTYNALGNRVSRETATLNVNNSYQSAMNGRGSAHVGDLTPAIEDWTGKGTADNAPSSPALTTSTWFDAPSTTRQANIAVERKEYVSDFTSGNPRDILVITGAGNFGNGGAGSGLDEYAQTLEYGLGLLSVTTTVTGAEETLNTIIAATRPKLYAHNNRLGGVSHFTDANGVLQSYNEYDAWGGAYTKRPTDQNFAGLDLDNIGFTGYGYDRVLDMYFAQARMYDVKNHRFTAVDPVAGNALNPQTLNPYAYCLNNPANLVDPWGLSEVQLRQQVEAMGGKISYNEKTKTATATVNGKTINVTDGVNGKIATSGENKDRFVVDSKVLESLKTAAVKSSVEKAEREGGFKFPPSYVEDFIHALEDQDPGMTPSQVVAKAKIVFSFIEERPELFKKSVNQSLFVGQPDRLATLAGLMANNLGSIALGSSQYEKRIDSVVALTNAEMAYYVMAYDVTHGYKSEFAGFADFSNSNAAAFNAIVQNVVEQVGAANMDANFHYTRNVFNQPFGTLDALVEYNQSVPEELRWTLMAPYESGYHMYGFGGLYNVKLISPDGHSEAVYDYNGNLVTLPLNMGTYNFVSSKYSVDAHTSYDVAPYNKFGNTLDDPAVWGPISLITAAGNSIGFMVDPGAVVHFIYEGQRIK